MVTSIGGHHGGKLRQDVGQGQCGQQHKCGGGGHQGVGQHHKGGLY